MARVDPEAHLPWGGRLRLIRRRWEHRGRNWLLALLRWILLKGNRTGKIPDEIILQPERSNIQQVLIIRTGKALGDALMSLVLVPECRKLFPKARVDFLLRDNISPLFREGAGVDHVLEWHPRILKWPRATLSLFRTLRSNRYDLVIACDNPFKSSFTTLCLTLFTGARHRAGFENEESRAFLNLPVSPTRDQHMVSNLLRLLAPFGGTVSQTLPRFEPPSHAMEAAEPLCGLGPNCNPILIFASNHWRKSWPLESFVRLATGLTARKYPVLLALGPGDDRADDPIIRQWIAQSNGLGRVLPPQSLILFAAILKRCRLFVANDGGPYHLAVAVGTPCVAAFRIKEGQREFGYEEPDRLVTVHYPDEAEAERMTLEAGLRLLELQNTKTEKRQKQGHFTSAISLPISRSGERRSASA